MSIEITINVRMDGADLVKVMESLLASLRAEAKSAQSVAPVISNITMPNNMPPASVVVTNGHKPVGPQKPVDAPKPVNKRPSSALSFPEFDELVRKEVKRLGMDGRLPGHLLWNDQRDKRLPTLQAVSMRYKCANLDALAKELGVEPPLSKRKSLDVADSD